MVRGIHRYPPMERVIYGIPLLRPLPMRSTDSTPVPFM